MQKVRAGIVLIVLSWLPVAQAGLAYAHSNNKLTSQHQSQMFRLAVWGVQIIIGFIGLWLVGEVAVQTAKQEGWRKAPGNIYRLFRNGDGSHQDTN